MKIPKHRGNVYVVQRKLQHDPKYPVIGVFTTYEGAVEFRDACEQDYLDRGFTAEEFEFFVNLSSFYDQ